MYRSDLQHCLDLGGDIGLLVELDALLVRAAGALHRNLLKLGQHHAVSMGHRLELLKQQLQQVQQQPAEGARGRGEGGRRGGTGKDGERWEGVKRTEAT